MKYAATLLTPSVERFYLMNISVSFNPRLLKYDNSYI